MATYEVTFSCGHTETVELFGKEKERERKIAYMQEHGECSACREASQEAVLSAMEAKYKLPALEGTERQVAWARKIRKKRMSDFNSMCDESRKKIEMLPIPNKNEVMAKNEEQIDFIINKFTAVTSAKFFIETNDDLYTVWMRKLIGYKKEM